jgi:hypothetical protein
MAAASLRATEAKITATSEGEADLRSSLKVMLEWPRERVDAKWDSTASDQC